MLSRRMKLTGPQVSMLMSFYSATRRGCSLAYTATLGAWRTWEILREKELTDGGQITNLGQEQLRLRGLLY